MEGGKWDAFIAYWNIYCEELLVEPFFPPLIIALLFIMHGALFFLLVRKKSYEKGNKNTTQGKLYGESLLIYHGLMTTFK